MRAAEASASLAGLYGSLASDDSDEDDEDYFRCYLRHYLCIRGQPMMMRLGDLVLLERILCCRSPPASRLLLQLFHILLLRYNDRCLRCRLSLQLIQMHQEQAAG